MTSQRPDSTSRPRRRGMLIACALALLVPLLSTVVLMSTETGLPSVGATIALLVLQNLVGLAGAVGLAVVGRRSGRVPRALAVAALVLAVLAAVGQVVNYVSINNIGAGMLVLLGQGGLAVVGLLVLALARRSAR